MSMNVHICAEGMITFPSGVTKYSEVGFNCLQTSTKETEQIVNSPDPIQAYKDWILSRWDKDEQSDISDYDRIDEGTGDFEVIGQEIYNFGKEHCKSLDEFIEDAKFKGLKIDVYST